MENPFKKLGEPHREVPSEVKKQVFEDIVAFKFFMEVAGLFSLNYA